jgi:hypothetical protein
MNKLSFENLREKNIKRCEDVFGNYILDTPKEEKP